MQMLLLGFADDASCRGIARELHDLAASGAIRLVDARVLVRSASGELAALRSHQLDASETAGRRCVDELTARSTSESGPEGRPDGPTALDVDAAIDVGGLGLGSRELRELIGELALGEPLLLVVVAHEWAGGLAAALCEGSVVSAQLDYLAPSGLVALGAMLDLPVDAVS